MIKRSVNISDPSTVFVLCIGCSFLLLAGAHLFERVGGLPPCLLCLEQREVHWTALLFGAGTFALARMANAPGRVMAAALGAISLVYVYSASLAGFHAGVEWGFWAGPETCSGGNAELASTDDLLASLSEKSLGPGCSEALWRMFGVSMAGYNAAISFALAGFAAMSSFTAARGLKLERVNQTALAE